MQSQTRNWILFFLSFVVIFVGYNWSRNGSFRRRNLPGRKTERREASRRDWPVQCTGGGLGDAARLAAAVSSLTIKSRNSHWPCLKEKTEKERKKQPRRPNRRSRSSPPYPMKPAKLIPSAATTSTSAVTLTNRGAGVHELTLTPFKAADWYGPAGEGTRRQTAAASTHPALRRHLRSPFITTPPHDKKRSGPSTRSACRDWQVVEKKTDGDEQRVAFATELPEFGVRLVKTFTLRPREYHLGLTVRVERMPGAKESVPFRYQLAGVVAAHCGRMVKPTPPNRVKLANKRPSPIEGESGTRAMLPQCLYLIGSMVDENPTIGHRSTAEPFGARVGRQRSHPAAPARRLQYAAVAEPVFHLRRSSSPRTQPKSRTFVEPSSRATVEGVTDQDPTKHRRFDDITVRAIADAIEPEGRRVGRAQVPALSRPVKVGLLEKLGGDGGISAELAERYERTCT